MKRLIIEGNNLLSGEINIGGAKNSAVALIPASLLSDEKVDINNIPNISDIDALNEILDYLGAKTSLDNNKISIDTSSIINKEIPEKIGKKLRASYYFMSALLGKYKYVEMYFPGGCSIGSRPIDQTLKGFRLLGANIIEKENKFIISADELIGNTVELDMPSVGATINTILVAVKAKGKTIIKNAAKEPEITNVIDFLNKMGANIKGQGTSTIEIEGVNYLHSANINVIPDRIEAGTYLIAGALNGKNLKINNINLQHIDSLLNLFKKMNIDFHIIDNSIIINKKDHIKPIDITTEVFPGFPTDLQQPLTTLLCLCDGESHIKELIYENRFQNVQYLNKMGANIKIEGRKISISGPTKFIGCDVEATDLRAGACLVLAALNADGTTVIDNVEHVLRGYENIVYKLESVGAKIQLDEI